MGGGPSVNILSWAAGGLCGGVGVSAWCTGALRQNGLQKSKEPKTSRTLLKRAMKRGDVWQNGLQQLGFYYPWQGRLGGGV